MPPAARRPGPRFYSLLAICALLLLALFLRTHRLLLFPPFIDEAHHILWASDVYSLHPFTGATNGKLFGLWWMAGFHLTGDAALWLARAATALFSLLGIAGLYGIGRLLVGRGLGLWTALAYSLMPIPFFFERLALLDSYVAVFAVLAVWGSLRATRTASRRDAALAGLALVGAVLAKATGVMLAVIPALALLLTPRWTWRGRVRALAASYGLFAVLAGGLYLVLRWRGYNYFSTATTVVGTLDMSRLLGRLADNFEAVARTDALYLGGPLLVAAALAAVYLLARRPHVGLFLLLSLLLPLAGLLMFATRLSTRYTQFHLPFLLLVLAIGLSRLSADLFRQARFRQTIIPAAAITVWGVMTALPFIDQFWLDPLGLAYAPYDRIEYLAGDSAGFGLPDIAADLQNAAAQDGPIQLVGLISNCEGLRRILPAASQISIACPPVSLDGSKQAEIAALVDSLAAQAGEAGDLWLVLEDDAPYFSLAGIQTPLVPVKTYTRPDGLTHMTVYRAVSPSR